MRLPQFAIKNYQFSFVLVILLVIMGIYSAGNMPRTEDPQITPPGSNIIVVYPGANPADLEEQVVDPIEEAVNELEDIKHIKTSIENGLTVIEVEFLIGSDPDDKYSDVVQKVNSVSSILPEEILYLEVMKFSISDVNILQLALVSESVPYVVLEDEAELLKKQLERIPGIQKVKTFAIPQREVRIALDLEKTASMRIPMSRIVGAVQGSSVNIPGGNIDLGSKRFNIKTSGSYESIEEIAETIVHSYDGKVVYLKDIADIQFNNEDLVHFARFNKARSVFVTISQKPGTNIFKIMDEVNSALEEFQKTLPDNVSMETAFNQSDSVKDRISSFFSNLAQGIVLVGLVMILPLGIRASFLAMLAIPLSILIAIGFIDLAGFGLQQMTIAGMVIALGLLVDNVIVVTEVVSRFLKKGHTRTDAAVKGTTQIGWAVVSATATTVLAFVPMTVMNNITGEFIRSMPLMVIFTLLASLFLSLTITPFLAGKLFKRDNSKEIRRFDTFLNTLLTRYYRPSLNYALKHPVIIILSATIILFGSLALFPLVGVSFFPKAEKPQFIVNITTPEGTSLDKTDQVSHYVESVITEKDEVSRIVANIGRGNPRIYYNVISRREKSTVAQLLVGLHEYHPVKTVELIQELREEFSQYAGAKIEVKELEQGPPVDAPVSIRVLGENLDILKQLAREVELIISTTQGTVNVNNPIRTSKTDLHVSINRAKAGIMGIPLFEIDKTVRTCFAGLKAAKYRDSEGEEYNIVVRLPFDQKLNMEDFDKVYISSVTGAQIPLSQLAHVEFYSTPSNISHYNLERNISVTADVRRDFSVNAVTQAIVEKLDNYNWPKGYRYYVSGELESREESFGGLGQAVLIALIGIFGVLVLQFRSFSQPLIVFSAIPLAVIGAIIMLLITGYSFSFTAFIGLTSLVGIVVNNSIILVDYTNQLRRSGKELYEAVKESAETRFLPIVLTTATTVGGLLPLTLQGGTMWAPMGWAIIGGLVVSTFLTLILVPVLYRVYSPKNI